jgi:HEAT repeat protein
MDLELNLTPDSIVTSLRKAEKEIEVGYQVINAFRNLSLKEKGTYLDRMVQFLEHEEKDRVRSWGTNILELIGGDKAFESVLGVFKETDTRDIKRRYPYTRGFALCAAYRLATTDDKKNQLKEILPKIRKDDDEWELPRAAAAASLMAMNGDVEATDWIKKMLRDLDTSYKRYFILRALKEFPLGSLNSDLIDIMKHIIQYSDFLDQKFIAIKILGKEEFKTNLAVVDALGGIATTGRNEYLRLTAIDSLNNLKNKQAKDELLQALQDSNAEVRLRASAALSGILYAEGAVAAIVNAALEPDRPQQEVGNFIDAIRNVDPSRKISTKILSDEMENSDQVRAKQAEKILVELGGWAAITRLSQRRRNLDKLQELLKDSGKIVTGNYENIMNQARYGFYFAMGINGLIVFIGVVLIIIALQNLSQNPGDLGTVLLPGGGGVLGFIYSAYFNDPRKYVKQDLASLLNVSVIFQGYLQELHHINATFNHMYIEKREFDTTDMTQTVEQITAAAEKALVQIKNNVNPPPEQKTDNIPPNGQ